MTRAFRLATALCAATILAFPFPAPAQTTDTSRWRQNHWRLEVRHERFRDQTTCHLANSLHKLRVIGGALRILVPGARPDAAYRLDGGPARLTRDDFPALLENHVPVDSGNMLHPTGHAVWIPLARIGDAQKLELQDHTGARAHPIDIKGLAALRRTAAEHGCADDHLIVE